MGTGTTTLINNPLYPQLMTFAHLLREEIHAEHILLFGSQARGNARTDSDYDLIVVSPSFRNKHPLRRGIEARQCWHDITNSTPVDMLCLTPEEFAEAQHHISLVAAVLPEAIDLLAAPVG